MRESCLAATLDRFGDADGLYVRHMVQPQPKVGQVVVQVAAAAINPIDVRRRAGYGRKLFGLMGAARLPLVLGSDVAGTVCAVGPGVRRWREGDAVFGAKPPSRHGTHATHVALDANHLRAQPAGVTPALLATLPYNFLTVWRALADAGITRAMAPGSEVLVHGASGGLGLIALALLKQLDADVTAVAGSRGLDACLAAGATRALDRGRHALETLAPRFTATLNFAHWDDDARLLARLAPGARGHATTVHPMLAQFDRYGVLAGALAALYRKRRSAAAAPAGARYSWTVFRPDGEALDALERYAATLAGSSAPLGYRLDDAAAAHRHVEQRRAGRAVLLPNDF